MFVVLLPKIRNSKPVTYS